MWFGKELGNNHYSVIGILDEFGLDKPLDHHDNKPLYELWDTSVFFIVLGCITKGVCISGEEWPNGRAKLSPHSIFQQNWI